MTTELCPCGSGNTYQTCCEPYLSGKLNAPIPEQLMRSRYTAFCKGNIDYLIATHHPSKRQPNDRQILAQTIAETEWQGLRVLNSTKADGTTNIGTVEFVAFYRSRGVLGQLHERSKFLKQNGRWYYLQGEILGPVANR